MSRPGEGAGDVGAGPELGNDDAAGVRTVASALIAGAAAYGGLTGDYGLAVLSAAAAVPATVMVNSIVAAWQDRSTKNVERGAE